jgi:hypothetical protein
VFADAISEVLNEMKRKRSVSSTNARGVHRLRAYAPDAYQWLRQLWILGERYWEIKKCDRWYWVILFIQPPVIAGLLILVFHGCDPYSGVLMFCLAISALWFGAFSSVREVVLEYGVYRRERLVGLRITTYILSKLPLLYAISFAQSVILLLIIYPVLTVDWAMGMAGNLLRAIAMLCILFLTAAGGVSLGLMLSTLSLILGRRTASRMGMVSSEVAMSLIPIALLPQVILGGPFYVYNEAFWVTRILSKLILARWSLSALLSLEVTGPRAFALQLGMRGESTTMSCIVIALFCFVLTLIAIGLMKYEDHAHRN